MSTDQCRSRPSNKGRRGSGGWGGGGVGHPDPEIRGGPGLQKKRFVALQASVWNKNQWGGDLLGPSPGSAAADGLSHGCK